MKPTSITANPDRLLISWSDGHASDYPMRYLRQWCRCARCVNEVSGEPILDPETIPAFVSCLKAEPTGHYGLTLTFSDSHKTGIYAYDYLRMICPCAQCQNG